MWLQVFIAPEGLSTQLHFTHRFDGGIICAYSCYFHMCLFWFIWFSLKCVLMMISEVELLFFVIVSGEQHNCCFCFEGRCGRHNHLFCFLDAGVIVRHWVSVTVRKPPKHLNDLCHLTDNLNNRNFLYCENQMFFTRKLCVCVCVCWYPFINKIHFTLRQK